MFSFRQNAVLDTMLEFEEWSPDLPESFFEGFGNANMTLAGTSLFITYKYGEMHKSFLTFL